LNDPFLSATSHGRRRTIAMLCAVVGTTLPMRCRAKYRDWLWAQPDERLEKMWNSI